MLNEDLIARYEALKLEIHQLIADKAEMSRVWHEEGKATPMSVRAATEAQLAKAQLERYRMRANVTKLREQAHLGRGNRLLAALIHQCRAAGLQNLIDAAHQDAARIEA